MKASRISIRSKDRIAMFADLSTMMSAGIPLMQCLDTLLEDARGTQQKVVKFMRQELSNGMSLSSAMEQLPRAFEPITVNLIRAAEAGGTLEETLVDIVHNLKKENEFSAGLKTMMIYPAFVGVIFLGIVVLILTFVAPRIEKVFSTMRVTLPAATKIMFIASDAFMSYWMFIVPGLVVAVILISIFVSYNKRLIIRGLLSLPGLSTLGNNIDLTRFSRSFALLLKAGVALDEALELSERVVQKNRVRHVVQRMREDIIAGNTLAQHLHESKHIIPTVMARSIETAETSGTLELTMQNLAEYFDEQVAQNLKVLSGMLEPVMILIVGVLVGGLMLTVMAPMYNLISQIQGK